MIVLCQIPLNLALKDSTNIEKHALVYRFV